MYFCLCFSLIFLNMFIKGFGIFTTQTFSKGSFLMEYVGDRISPKEAEKRERKRKGHSYVYYFKWNGMQW